MIGSWKNIDELEESLTIDELFLLLNKKRELKSDEQNFAASLKGIDLKGQEQEAKLEEVKRRAQEKLNPNYGQEQLEMLGISFEEE